MILRHLLLSASLVLAPVAMVAQATPTPGQHDYNIQQRKADQQGRIANGVKSGQLTAGETGHLTLQDRTTIHQQQNQESRRIYRDKHNAKVQ